MGESLRIIPSLGAFDPVINIFREYIILSSFYVSLSNGMAPILESISRFEYQSSIEMPLDFIARQSYTRKVEANVLLTRLTTKFCIVKTLKQSFNRYRRSPVLLPFDPLQDFLPTSILTDKHSCLFIGLI